jgi:hypothetical protein
MAAETKYPIDWERIIPKHVPIPDPIPWWRFLEKLQGENLRRLVDKQFEVQITVMEKQIELLRECQDIMRKAKL